MNSKKLIGLLFIGYSLLGLRLAGANDLQLPIDTTENGGVRAEASLVEAVADMVAKSTAEATKLSAEIAEINARAAAGEITEDQAEAEIAAAEAAFEARMEVLSSSMEEWGESFGERMEKWGESFGKRLEKDLEDLDDIDIDIDFDIAELEDEEEEERPNSGQKSFDYFEIQVGTVSMVDNNQNISTIGQAVNPYKSNTLGVSFGKKHKVFGPGSPLVYQIGIGVRSESFQFVDGRTLAKVETPTGVETQLITPTGFNQINRSEWTLSYIEAAHMLHVDLSPRSKVDKHVSLGVGFYLGVRGTSIASVYGTDMESEPMTLQTLSNLNTSFYRMGWQAQLGYKTLKLTGRLDASNLFQASAYPEDTHIASLAIGWCW